MGEEKINLMFVGAGRMAQAMISGLVKSNAFSVLVGNNQDEEKLRQVKEKFKVSITTQWQEEVKYQDVIVLAMPPAAHDAVLKDLSERINKQLIITVAAGIDTAYLEKRLPSGTPVIWAMPNTAADLGKSITLYATGVHTDEQDLNIAQDLLAGIGTYQQVSKDQLHLLTAITGSAPAFIYEIAAILEKLAIETGVTEEQARNMVSNMIYGSGAMLKTGKDPSDLSAQVATPGGSTAAGLEVLKKADTEEIIRTAIEACRKKSKG